VVSNPGLRNTTLLVKDTEAAVQTWAALMQRAFALYLCS
jgi:hypothetical protein